jgi:NADH-quinone oxidoreductase subunit G
MRKILIEICFGSSCFIRKNKTVSAFLNEYLTSNNMFDKFEVKAIHCKNECQNGPNIYINKKLFSKITKKRLIEILNEYYYEK